MIRVCLMASGLFMLLLTGCASQSLPEGVVTEVEAIELYDETDPLCARQHEILKPLIERYKGEVSFRQVKVGSAEVPARLKICGTPNLYICKYWKTKDGRVLRSISCTTGGVDGRCRPASALECNLRNIMNHEMGKSSLEDQILNLR